MMLGNNRVGAGQVAANVLMARNAAGGFVRFGSAFATTLTARQVYPDSSRLAAAPKSAESGHNPTWCLRFSFREWLGDFAGVVDEKLRGGAERAILQGDNSDWHVGMLQVNGQDLDVRTFGKTQYRPPDNRKKTPGRQETDPHRGVHGENTRARILQAPG